MAPSAASSDPPPEDAAPPPGPPAPPPPTVPRPPGAPLTREELARLLFPPGGGIISYNGPRPPPQPSPLPTTRVARPTPERPDEKCWTRCRQTNARRALGREPTCTSWCYITLRNQIKSLTPVPGVPGAFLARDEKIEDVVAEVEGVKKGKAVEEDPLPKYHWPWLEGRFLYIARGRDTVARHMSEMTGTGAFKTIKERCEKSEQERKDGGAKLERERRRMRRAVGLEDDEEYERLVSLSQYYSATLRRFHAHILRIYTPVFHNLARLPTVLSDGTAATMAGTVVTKLTDGSAFKLAERMGKSTVEVSRRLREMRERRGGEGGEGPGFNGSIGGLGGGLGGPPVAPPPV